MNIGDTPGVYFLTFFLSSAHFGAKLSRKDEKAEEEEKTPTNQHRMRFDIKICLFSNCFIDEIEKDQQKSSQHNFLDTNQ